MIELGGRSEGEMMEVGVVNRLDKLKGTGLTGQRGHRPPGHHLQMTTLTGATELLPFKCCHMNPNSQPTTSAPTAVTWDGCSGCLVQWVPGVLYKTGTHMYTVNCAL